MKNLSLLYLTGLSFVCQTMLAQTNPLVDSPNYRGLSAESSALTTQIRPADKPRDVEASQPIDFMKEELTDKPISLHFQAISVRAVLHILADFKQMNMVVSDSVKGNITLRLDAVSWEQALNVILTTQSLNKRTIGDIMLIAPSAEIAVREKQAYDTPEELKQSVSLRSEIIQVNYAKADDLANLIKNKSNSVLSKRGQMSVDIRTNSIWIQDTDDKIEEVIALIKKLDVPIKQVLIETRIVDVTKNAALDLGIEWGMTHPHRLSGALSGENQLTQGEVKPTSDRLSVDLGVQPALLRAASVGVAVATLGSNILLDLELSALEGENKAKVVASPRVVTTDQQEAYISSGEQIPYQRATSSGATAVSFVQAVLGLRVQPQITPNGRILMKLKINQDRASTTLYNGVPAILTKEIDTNVLVDDGETIVLGGIFQQDQANNITRVPFLGDLPVVGGLFKRMNRHEKREELLVFITPKIITQKLQKKVKVAA